MKDKKKKYWEEPEWDPLSPKRKYFWSVSAPFDYQDILSTWECLVGDDDAQDTPEPTEPR